jgi:small subunit ribosomal protein S5
MATKPAGKGRRRRGDSDDGGNIEDVLVKLYRCATVVKGGRRFSFGSLTVVGDRRGRVGYGYAKANEVPPSVEKSIKQARRRLMEIPLRGATIPHRVMGRFGASRVLLIPATPGTGVIAGSAPRAVLELAGIKDVLTKCYGSTSPKNLVKATIDGLMKLRTRSMVEELRGVKLDHLPDEPEAVEEVTAEAKAETGRPASSGAATAPSATEIAQQQATPPAESPDAEKLAQAEPFEEKSPGAEEAKGQESNAPAEPPTLPDNTEPGEQPGKQG